MAYCHPRRADPSCAICTRAASDPAFAAAVGAVPPPAWSPAAKQRVSISDLVARKRH